MAPPSPFPFPVYTPRGYFLGSGPILPLPDPLSYAPRGHFPGPSPPLPAPFRASRAPFPLRSPIGAPRTGPLPLLPSAHTPRGYLPLFPSLFHPFPGLSGPFPPDPPGSPAFSGAFPRRVPSDMPPGGIRPFPGLFRIGAPMHDDDGDDRGGARGGRKEGSPGLREKGAPPKKKGGEGKGRPLRARAPSRAWEKKARAGPGRACGGRRGISAMPPRGD